MSPKICMSTTLKIKNPTQYGVVWDKPEEISDSIFCPIYKDALKNVNDIISANTPKNKTKLKISPERSNNIIAFVGKRGSGKSTAMCNFANILRSISNMSDLTWAKALMDDETLDCIKKINFHTLNVIDSAQLGIKETIIGRISAAMYSHYKNIVSRNEPQLSAEKKRRFISNLSDVNRYAVMYHTGEWFKNQESLLDDTYHISSLKSEMKNLLYSYLQLVSEKEKIENEYLVVSIDDLDMGIENAYAIMEEIRKFLCLPNLIILVTLRMDQIHVTLKSTFDKQLDGKIDSTNDANLIRDLAYRYSEKLFPYARQHHMPVLSVDQLHNWKAVFETSYSHDGDEYCNTVMHSVLYLIWKKTLMILACDKNREHFLVPSNLRSLCHLVAFLQKLPDIKTTSPGYNPVSSGTSAEVSDLTAVAVSADPAAAVSAVQSAIPSAQLAATRSQNISLLSGQEEILKNNIHEFYQYLVANIRSFEYEYISEEDKNFSDVLISIIHNIEHMPLTRMNANIVGDILYYLKSHNDTYYHNIFNDIIVPPGSVTGAHGSKTELEILFSDCMHPENISLGDLMHVLGKIDSKTRCRYIKYLIEVIRTLWSARMTEEYFTKSNYIDSRFSSVVGNLIVNPDVGFFESSHSDFVHSTTTKDHDPMFYVGNFEENATNWRTNRSVTLTENGNHAYHPLAPLTNSQVFNNIPFYSFDFVYRFYEVLHDSITDKPDFAWKVVELYGLDSSIMLALKKMLSYDNENKWILDEKIISLSSIETSCLKVRNLIPEIKSPSEFIENLTLCKDTESIEDLITNLDKYEISTFTADQIKEIKETKIPSDTLPEQLKSRIKSILEKENYDN